MMEGYDNDDLFKINNPNILRSYDMAWMLYIACVWATHCVHLLMLSYFYSRLTLSQNWNGSISCNFELSNIQFM